MGILILYHTYFEIKLMERAVSWLSHNRMIKEAILKLTTQETLSDT